ncbi:hypothetical protein SEA_SCHWARTZ33_19 [Gordonia phage Schwartz33]|nr:hypothetical protein SEA_SCHWARTZ33_19 [Gordonia phage Schwartz33]
MLKNEAMKLFLKVYPRRSIKWTTFYDGAWYILAIDERDKFEGSMNPYFKVDPTTKAVTEYSPTLDPEHFNAMISSGG